VKKWEYLNQVFSLKGYEIKMEEFARGSVACYAIIYVFKDIGQLGDSGVLTLSGSVSGGRDRVIKWVEETVKPLTTQISQSY